MAYAALPSSGDAFTKLVNVHVQGLVRDIVDSEAEEAASRVKQRIKETLPKVVMTLFDDYSVAWENNNTTLVIKVQIKEPKNA